MEKCLNCSSEIIVPSQCPDRLQDIMAKNHICLSCSLESMDEPDQEAYLLDFYNDIESLSALKPNTIQTIINKLKADLQTWKAEPHEEL